MQLPVAPLSRSEGLELFSPSKPQTAVRCSTFGRSRAFRGSVPYVLTAAVRLTYPDSIESSLTHETAFWRMNVWINASRLPRSPFPFGSSDGTHESRFNMILFRTICSGPRLPRT